MTDHDDSLSEDELLALPQQAPGTLSRLWAICSRLMHPHEADEFNCEIDAPLRTPLPWNNPHPTKPSDCLQYEQALRDIGDRWDHLLLCTGDEQREIDERRKDIEDNALRLRDGRRVYVDGDRCRDGEGRVLTGADEAEAARLHEYSPDASTWQRKQDINRRADENQKLTDKILKDRQHGQDTPEQTSERLDNYEKEFAGKVQARRDGVPARSLHKDAPHGTAGGDNTQSITDYATADNMNAFGDDYQISAVPAFTAAARGVSREAIRRLGDAGSGTQTQKPSRHSGQSAAPKLQV